MNHPKDHNPKATRARALSYKRGYRDATWLLYVHMYFY